MLSLWMTHVPMDNRPTRYNDSCLLDLNDSHGRIRAGTIFSSPSIYIYIYTHTHTQYYIYEIFF